jgi:hypothetical protein
MVDMALSNALLRQCRPMPPGSFLSGSKLPLIQPQWKIAGRKMKKHGNQRGAVGVNGNNTAQHEQREKAKPTVPTKQGQRRNSQVWQSADVKRLKWILESNSNYDTMPDHARYDAAGPNLPRSHPA